MLQNSEVIDSENHGNFRHLLRYRIDAGDNTFKLRISDSSIKKLSTSISKTIQKQLLITMCNVVKENIAQDINSVDYWSYLVDESTDR